MLVSLLVFFAGLALLYYGAEWLVSGSSRLAFSYGVRPLVVGMTVVAFATSMPELLVSLVASLRDSANIASGNIVGSNIANIGLVLGTAALLMPLEVSRTTMRRELPWLLGGSFLFCLLGWDGLLSRGDGLLQFLLLIVFIAYCLRTARGGAQSPLAVAGQGERRRDILLILVGIVGLALGAEMMVRSAVSMARQFGVSELVIGVSIVAIGTSLPELAASVMSAAKGEMELSVGNVIGSNLFNLQFVLGLCPMIKPLRVDPALYHLELPLMIGFSLALLVLLLPRRCLGRGSGLALLAGYAAFILSLTGRL